MLSVGVSEELPLVKLLQLKKLVKAIFFCSTITAIAGPVFAQSVAANRGIICIDNANYLSEWETTDLPVSSVVAHWFDDHRVYTTNWIRSNDYIKPKTPKFGKKYTTDSDIISWQFDFLENEEKMVEINRADASRSIRIGEVITVTVDCNLIEDRATFKDQIEEVTVTLQGQYDKAIADHKL